MNNYRNEAGGVVGAIPYEVLVVIFQEWHACTCSTPADIINCLAFELSKLRFRGHM